MALRVLLADENVTIKKVIQLSLSDYAVSVKSVNLGIDVLEVAREFQPDIVFADILLQKRNGYDVSMDFKTDPELSQIPVVLLWSGFMELDRERYRDCGANAELEKPFDKENLRRLVQGLVPKTMQAPLTSHIQLAPAPAIEMGNPPALNSGAGMESHEAPSSAGPPPPPPSMVPPELAQHFQSMPTPEAAPPAGSTPPPINPPMDPNLSIDPRTSQELTTPKSVKNTPSSPPPSSAWSMDSFDEIEDFVQRPLGEISSDSESNDDFSLNPPTPPPSMEMTEDRLEEPAETLKPLAPIPAEPAIPEAAPSSTTPEEPWIQEDLSAFRLEVSVEDEELLGPATPNLAHEFNLDPLEEEVTSSKIIRTDDLPPENPEKPAPRPETPLQGSAPTAPAAVPQLSEEKLEEILRAQSREMIESVVWKIVPDLAERIIREELAKFMEDS